ncbi:MAG: tripartite tricarboxylate transporter TctB family protein [Roseobacter sp.]
MNANTDEKAQHRSDVWLGVISASVACVALLLIPAEVSSDGWSHFADARHAAFFPLWTGSTLLAFSVALMVRSVRAAGGPRFPRLVIPFRVILAAVALGAAAFALFWLGFLFATAGLIAALALILGERRAFIIVLLAVLVPLAIQFLFRGLLNVLLPTGLF